MAGAAKEGAATTRGRARARRAAAGAGSGAHAPREQLDFPHELPHREHHPQDRVLQELEDITVICMTWGSVENQVRRARGGGDEVRNHMQPPPRWRQLSSFPDIGNVGTANAADSFLKGIGKLQQLHFISLSPPLSLSL